MCECTSIWTEVTELVKESNWSGLVGKGGLGLKRKDRSGLIIALTRRVETGLEEEGWERTWIDM